MRTCAAKLCSRSSVLAGTFWWPTGNDHPLGGHRRGRMVKPRCLELALHHVAFAPYSTMLAAGAMEHGLELPK